MKMHPARASSGSGHLAGPTAGQRRVLPSSLSAWQRRCCQYVLAHPFKACFCAGLYNPHVTPFHIVMASHKRVTLMSLCLCKAFYRASAFSNAWQCKHQCFWALLGHLKDNRALTSHQ